MTTAHYSYGSYESVMGPVRAAIANGTLFPPRPAPKLVPVATTPHVSTLTVAERIQLDNYMHQDKLDDGYEKRRVARAIRGDFRRTRSGF